jgi:hypothetical protein
MLIGDSSRNIFGLAPHYFLEVSGGQGREKGAEPSCRGLQVRIGERSDGACGRLAFALIVTSDTVLKHRRQAGKVVRLRVRPLLSRDGKQNVKPGVCEPSNKWCHRKAIKVWLCAGLTLVAARTILGPKSRMIIPPSI